MKIAFMGDVMLGRFVIDWEVSISLDKEFVLDCLKRAFLKAKPEILNSDQGVQMTSEEYISLVTGNAVQISMDHRGRCFDNIFTERLWRSVKYEEVYLKEYTSPKMQLIIWLSTLSFTTTRDCIRA